MCDSCYHVSCIPKCVNIATVVLELFAGIKYCVSADIQKKIVIFNIALANQNHNIVEPLN